jgi:hypothetical protein
LSLATLLDTSKAVPTAPLPPLPCYHQYQNSGTTKVLLIATAPL